MIVNFIYVVLALIGIGILIFIHELGHYFAAKWMKMRIEVFSIGFGKPIYSWKRGQVKWQICMLPFGGYVKIYGMQKEKGKELQDMPGGFFSKSPLKRMLVSFAGPFANILLAMLIFTGIYFFGGRIKPFAEFTKKIGYIAPKSPMASLKIEAGNEILQYNDKYYHGYKDLLYAVFLEKEIKSLRISRIDYFNNTRRNYLIDLTPLEIKKEKRMDLLAIAPAAYLIYTRPVGDSSPVQKAGMLLFDRIVWMDGELLFSAMQVKEILNRNSAFLTIEREGKIFHVNVPVAELVDFRISAHEKSEIADLRYEANLNEKLEKLKYIPALLNSHLMVQKTLNIINENLTIAEAILQPGDRILAIGQEKVNTAAELLQKLQKKSATIIVERNPNLMKVGSWKNEDTLFDQEVDSGKLMRIINSIGQENIEEKGKYHLLKDIEPVRPKDVPSIVLYYNDQKERIEKTKDPKKKNQLQESYQSQLQDYSLGVFLSDKKVKYNPPPWSMFKACVMEMYRVVHALFDGAASAKILSGPVGIIHVMQQSFNIGISESLYGLAFISINLGIVNLLPFPILDGGYILLSFVEIVIRRPIKAKYLEKFIIPFVILIILFAIYVTYNDIIRIFQAVFN